MLERNLVPRREGGLTMVGQEGSTFWFATIDLNIVSSIHSVSPVNSLTLDELTFHAHVNSVNDQIGLPAAPSLPSPLDRLSSPALVPAQQLHAAKPGGPRSFENKKRSNLDVMKR